MNLNDWADIATIVTAAAVLVAILSFVGDRSQRHREFESLYVQRYWAIHDRQSADARLGRDAKLRKADRALALDYLRLCPTVRDRPHGSVQGLETLGEMERVVSGPCRGTHSTLIGLASSTRIDR